MNELWSCSERVARALAAREPVVALETTVVTHGLPHPEGIAAALALEEEVRDSGATPATIGVLRGAIRIGLTRDELDELATAPGVCKTNLSNLAAVVASGGAGSTTVAATMFAAHANGIRVFATGGIGGVHRGAGRERRRLGRSHGTRAPARRSGLRGCQGHPRSATHPRDAGDVGRAGARPGDGRVPGVLSAIERAAGGSSRGLDRGSRRQCQRALSTRSQVRAWW